MLTTKQIKFCEEVSIGKSATEAYRIAFKSRSEGTCKVNASKLLKSQEINKEIERLKQINQSIVNAANQKAIDKVAEYQIATKAERMEILTKIMRGELKMIKQDVFQGMVTDVEVAPDFSDRKNAITELNKMCGDYEPTKTDIRINKAGLDAVKEKYE